MNTCLFHALNDSFISLVGNCFMFTAYELLRFSKLHLLQRKKLSTRICELILSHLAPNASFSIDFNFIEKIIYKACSRVVFSTPGRNTSFIYKSKISLRKDYTLLQTSTFHATLFALNSTKVPAFIEKFLLFISNQGIKEIF